MLQSEIMVSVASVFVKQVTQCCENLSKQNSHSIFKSSHSGVPKVGVGILKGPVGKIFKADENVLNIMEA